MYVSAFQTPNLKGITHIPGRPRQYRADCRVGEFKIGESKFTGAKLNMEILSWRTFADQLFDYPHQTCLEVLFVDPHNIVSHILFKTESLGNFPNLTLDLATDVMAFGTGVSDPRTVALAISPDLRTGTFKNQ